MPPKKRKINCDFDELDNSYSLEKELCEAFDRIDIKNSNLHVDKILALAVFKHGVTFLPGKTFSFSYEGSS